MKIVFLDRESLGTGISLNSIEKQGELIIYDYTSAQDVTNRIADAQILIVNKVVIGKNEIDAAPELKLICVAATGMNNIDLKYAALKGITVRNAVNYSTDSVVQVTFGSLLSLITNIRYFDDCVKNGIYSQSKHFTDTGKTFSEVSGKVFGVVGMGTIGKKVARVASAFGADVVYYSTNGTAHCPEYKSVTLNELLSICDIISIHAPLNEKTENLFMLEQLKKMKKSSIIVNMGRGGIVNENDLVTALNENIISGAVVDVYKTEPIGTNHAYFNIEDKNRVIFTPHIGWASIEARDLLVNKIALNIENFLLGN